MKFLLQPCQCKEISFGTVDEFLPAFNNNLRCNDIVVEFKADTIEVKLDI